MRAITALDKKIAKLKAKGKSVTGCLRQRLNLEYALAAGHRVQTDKNGIQSGGGKKSPLAVDVFEPPCARPPFFWHNHRRVWGREAFALGVENGAIVAIQTETETSKKKKKKSK